MNAFFKAALMGLWLALLILPAILAKKLGKDNFLHSINRLFFRGIFAIVGVETEVCGVPCKDRPLLFVCNHLSYWDIPILAAYTNARFTPKSEIRDWPVINLMCWLAGAIYIDRKPDKIKKANDAVLAALEQNDAIIIFPEATTGNGIKILPFKSGLFSLAEQSINGKTVTVQPIAISYSTLRGLPIDLTQWPKIAWYGDSELIPHLWEFLDLGKIRVTLAFLDPITIFEYENRKLMAEHCHKVICEKIENLRTQVA